MESMLVENQYMRGPPMRPFELEMASSSLTMEEKAILQARMHLLGFRSPFPSPPGMSHGMSQHLQNQMNHLNGMNMNMASGFPFGPGPPPPGSPSSAQSSRISDMANALNINGSLSQLYCMAAANSGQNVSHHLNTRGGQGGGGSNGASSPNHGPPPNPQPLPLPIQLWTQWASLHGLHGLGPSILAHQAQLAAAMAAASNQVPTSMSSTNHHNPFANTSPISNSMSNGGSTNGSRAGSPSGNNVASGNESSATIRLPRPFYPGNHPSSIGPAATSPLGGGIHRYSPYSMPINNLAGGRGSHHGSGGGMASNNKSPPGSPLGSPDSGRGDEAIS